MIRVAGLEKRFGRVRAVRGVSFSIGAGEVVGFVGPNGAGKTTTLRMLTGYLAADGGTVEIAGHDLASDRRSAQAKLGYLPEAAPLHRDMRVEEHLRYRARLKGVSRGRLTERVDAAIAAVEIADVRRRLIGRLSRGYRQRVALADALVADPPVLILDEPTTGLDPVQRRELRALLTAEAARRTVLLSSHVLPEVEAIADRFVVLAAGRVVADGDAEAICSAGGGASLEDAFVALVSDGQEAS